MAKQKSPSMIRWETSPGYVYFIAAGDPAIAIKIGISTQNDIKRRFSTIQGGNHEPLRLLGVVLCETMTDAMRREQELHARFADLQLAGKGWAGSEWFRPAQELLDFIEAKTENPKKRGLQESIYRKRQSPLAGSIKIVNDTTR